MQARTAERIAATCFTVVIPSVVALMIPHVDPAIGWPIVVASAVTGIAAFLHAGRRLAMLPMIVMALGAAIFLAGAIWNYRVVKPSHVAAAVDPNAAIKAEIERKRLEAEKADLERSAVFRRGLDDFTNAISRPEHRVATVRKPAAQPKPAFDFAEAQTTIRGLWNVWLDKDSLTPEEISGLVLPPDDWMNERLEKMGRPYRVRAEGSQFKIFASGGK